MIKYKLHHISYNNLILHIFHMDIFRLMIFFRILYFSIYTNKLSLIIFIFKTKFLMSAELYNTDCFRAYTESSHTFLAGFCDNHPLA